ncbi:hypothetical protein FBUS_00024 [Fasciolopsis buskii]|uniref:TUG ubiquitin-like domain-containing protein n=1 Tax=Fasciolopsis buskii TaxID=27845 RepID=A0A8E0RS72_9TREM|nr:hypothetical protein FBUS_00024 [Fasciolopsis buski]
MACEKRDLDSSQYILTHNRRPIDLSVTFRLSGLVNRATVDLVTLTPDDCRRVCESPNKVRVCLRLENGERAVWEGDPNCPFWTILKETSSTNQQLEQFLQSDDGNVPAVAYLGEKVIGEAKIQSTCLRDLGVSSGSVLLQLFRCSSAEDPQQKEQKQLSKPVPSPSVSRNPVESTISTLNEHEPKRPRTGTSSKPSTEPITYSSHVTCENRNLSTTCQMTEGKPLNSETAMADSNVDSIWSVFATPRQVSMFDHKPAESQRNVPEEPQTLGSLLGIDLTPERGPLPSVSETAFPFQNFAVSWNTPKNAQQN